MKHLLRTIKGNKPNVSEVFLRSDEAGCYHNNNLIAAALDVGEEVGIKVMSYDFSEPQFGKDVCDRIISPMKSAIRRYCNEGNDIMSASDMYEALRARQNQNPAVLKEVDNYGLFATVPRAIKPTSNDPEASRDDDDDDDVNDIQLVCQEPGCSSEFSSVEELEDHIHLGRHNTSENLYDGLRRAWALKFSSLTLESQLSSTVKEVTGGVNNESSNIGWALQKPRGGGTRFAENVKDYLSTRFNTGETTGRKADPAQVAADMKKARNTDGTRKFKRSEWLTKTQVQGFFSRLAAKRRKGTADQVEDDNDDDDSLIEDELVYLDDKARREAVEDIVSQVGLVHPITYDGHDICEYARHDTLSKFNVTTLKAMCAHFELPHKSRDLNSSLVNKVKDMVKECTCFK
ncbi:hypothetical protein ACROYT_G022908 [Oculina patagonica]